MRLLLTLILLLLPIYAQTEEILIPAWSDMYAAEYRAQIEPEPIIIDLIVIEYLEVQGIDIAKLTVEQIQLIEFAIDAVGTDTLVIFSFSEIVRLGKYLRDAVFSVRLSYWLENKDIEEIQQSKLPEEIKTKLVSYLKGKELPVPKKPKFFVGLGTFHLGNDFSEYLALSKIDCYLVYVSNYLKPQIMDLVKQFKATSKQIVFAFDFFYTDISLMELANQFTDVRNIEGEPVVHSVVARWSKHNLIDLKDYKEFARIQNEIIVYLKSQCERLFVWELRCLTLPFTVEWANYPKTPGDGIWWYGVAVHSLEVIPINIPGDAEGKPRVLGGVLKAEKFDEETIERIVAANWNGLYFFVSPEIVELLR